MIDDFKLHMEDNGHKMLSIRMYHDNQYKKTICKDVGIYLKQKIKEMRELKKYSGRIESK